VKVFSLAHLRQINYQICYWFLVDVSQFGLSVCLMCLA